MCDLRYPIGQVSVDPASNRRAEREGSRAVHRCAGETSGQMRAAVQGLAPEQLDTPYRPEGWTVRQVVHHVPDSHMNAYIRFKLALTEEQPPIKPYNEAEWAKLPDNSLSRRSIAATTGSVALSLG